MSTASVSADKSVLIRPYEEGKDFPALVAFIAMQYEHERDFQRLARRHGGVVAPRYAEDLLRAVRENAGCLLVADVGENPVGFVAAYCLSDPDPVLEESARRHGYVRDIFVLPNWRRMKVALRLLREAEGHFRTHGVKNLRIAGPAQNTAMVKFCENHGYGAHVMVFEKPVAAPSHVLVDGQLVKGE